MQGLSRITQIKHKDPIFVLIVATAILFLAFIHGLLPHLPTVFDHSRYSSIECGSQHFVEMFQAKCPVTGGDPGRNYFLGLSATIIGAIMYLLLPLEVEIVFSIVGTFFLGLCFFGTYKLIRLMKVSKYVAVGGASAYLLSPIIISMHGFGGTYLGVLLLPFALYVVWNLLNTGLAVGKKKEALTILAWIA